MKLYEPYLKFQSCGVTALEIITGLKQETIARKILKMRERYPLNEKGYRCSKKRMYTLPDTVFHNELIAFLKGRGHKLKMIHPPKRKQRTVINMATIFCKGTYLCVIPDHAIVISEGTICDNRGLNQSRFNYEFRKDKVLCYAKLD
jgi:hypothetical protein